MSTAQSPSYTGRLGFTLEQQMGPAFAIVSRDDLTTLASAGRRARPRDRCRRTAARAWRLDTGSSFEVDDLPAKVAELRQAGLSFRNEIVTGPGGKQIVVEDSDGNPVELFEAAR